LTDIEESFVERRGWPREIIHRVIDEARLLLPPHGERDAPATEVINISASGAGVLMPMRLEKGTQVRLKILGKEAPMLDIEAEVRWSAESPVSTGEFPAGLKFLPLASHIESNLQAFIEKMRQHRPPQA